MDVLAFKTCLNFSNIYSSFKSKVIDIDACLPVLSLNTLPSLISNPKKYACSSETIVSKKFSKSSGLFIAALV